MLDRTCYVVVLSPLHASSLRSTPSQRERRPVFQFQILRHRMRCKFSGPDVPARALSYLPLGNCAVRGQSVKLEPSFLLVEDTLFHLLVAWPLPLVRMRMRLMMGGNFSSERVYTELFKLTRRNKERERESPETDQNPQNHAQT